MIKQLLRSKLTWSNTCIVLIGPKTHSREWVNWEIEQAYKKQNTLCPLLFPLYEHQRNKRIQLPAQTKRHRKRHMGKS